ncbi:Thiamine import ATP-binding protein ThiQ [Candidatus Arsenophonus lipoptenae]|uniref:Thiamine import ATP-binding protein ThiQ n=1 Tax=Candidatus Arsenophonus lipoptenae TaxID=634113 RepID=A0A0X9VSL2_9GAMM|nr:thiamine ABC transporter ATP-binding protein ThiQ [Candidatus Arsenophonus lipoptenae]AMA64967.1 Thiamine import ATP-binding protein ThiQ [Candidatus Arsenophonus lipoptenae]
MIKLDNLIYSYNKVRMQFDFQVSKAEKVVILGPSGAGKSTLLYLIAGFKFSQSGKILLDGKNHTTSLPEKRPVSILFQENNLFHHLTVWQNIALGIAPNLHLDRAQQVAVNNIIEQVSLNNCIQCLPSQISGGQRQRTALARCLIRKKPILLLDEPFSALDPVLRNEMLTLLKQVCDKHQLTLLMVSHNLEDTKKIAIRAILIAEEKIAYDGQLDNLINGLTQESILLGITPR